MAKGELASYCSEFGPPVFPAALRAGRGRKITYALGY